MSKFGYQFVRTLFRWYPRSFRLRFEERMVEAFDLSRQILRHRWGRIGSPLAYLRLTVDTLVRAPVERFRALLSLPFVAAFQILFSPQGFARELTFATRALRRRPLRYAGLILTLGLAIGANSALYAVVDRVLLRSINVSEPERVQVIWKHDPVRGVEDLPVSIATFSGWKERSRSFESLGGFATVGQWAMAWQRSDGTWMDLDVAPVTWEFFDVHEVAATVGRLPLPEDGERSGGRVAGVLGYEFWQRTFGESDDAVGQVLELPDLAVEVIGVAPPGIEFASQGDLWIVLTSEQFRRRVVGLAILGRLRDGVERDAAFDELSLVSAEVARALGPGPSDERIVMQDLKTYTIGPIRPTLLLFTAAGAILFFLATSNAATLTLISFSQRREQFRMRRVLGASRIDLAIALIADLAIPTALAVGLGLVVARIALLGAGLLPDESIPHVTPAEIQAMDLSVVAFGVMLSVVTIVLLVGWTLSVGSHGDEVNPDVRRTRTARRSSPTGFGPLITIQIGLSVVLLAGAALLVLTFYTLQTHDRGFVPNNMTAVSVSLSPFDHGGPEGTRSAYRQIVRTLEADPNIEAVTTTLVPPLSETAYDIQYVAEGQSPEDAASNPWANVEVVDLGYFDAVGTRILQGRRFETGDYVGGSNFEEGTPVLFNLLRGSPLVISASFAERHWSDSDPLGARVRLNVEGAPWMTVVGVAEDSHYRSIVGDRLNVYLPLGRTPWLPSQVMVRSSLTLSEVMERVRSAVAEVAPSQSIQRAQSVEALIRSELGIPRFRSALASMFAVTALLLSIVGTYGVVASCVRSRQSEVGIRRTLGAPRRSVIRLLTTDALRSALIGIVLGLLGTVALLPTLRDLLYPMNAAVGWVLVATIISIFVIVSGAALVPAIRGIRMELRDVLSESGRADS